MERHNPTSSHLADKTSSLGHLWKTPSTRVSVRAFCLGAVLLPLSCAAELRPEASDRGDELGEPTSELATAAGTCDAIAQKLQLAQQEQADLKELYDTLPNGAEKWDVLRQWRAANALVAQLRTELYNCLHPPVPLPDLVPVRVIMQPHADRTAVDAALVVQNVGQGPVNGPFQIVFGATVPGLFRQATFAGPSSMSPGATFTTPYMLNIPSVRDATGVASYRFDGLVDSEAQVVESVENNNNLTQLVRDHR